MFILRASNGNFYTGRAGDNWLSPSKTDAFTYSERPNAEWKQQTFNRATVLHGLTFTVVAR